MKLEFAQREFIRYWSLTTGQLSLPQADDDRPAVWIGIAGDLPENLPQDIAAAALEIRPEGSWLEGRDGKLYIIGADAQGALYGVYHFFELQGVCFHLHGDSIPEVKRSPVIEDFQKKHQPLFAVRGIHPFHNFPEGPDAWTEEAYCLHIAQMAKMGLNFIGFHTYTGEPCNEPQVWVGLEEDVSEDGRVRHADMAFNWHPGCDTWGYGSECDAEHLPMGAGGLIGQGQYRDVAQSPSEAIALFNEVGMRWKRVFKFAHQVGVQTCLSLEIPLRSGPVVEARLRHYGYSPDNAGAQKALFRGIFTRILRSHPLDMFWLYIPESWVWVKSVPAPEFAAVVNAVKIATQVIEELGQPFRLGIASWVIGPQDDPLALDRELPEGIPIAVLSGAVGHLPVSPWFRMLKRRKGWAIPWMEDDPRLTVPQLWAGRTLRDAGDAHALGCEGLLGIHWRCRGLSPQFQALARSAWEQPHNPNFGEQLTETELRDALAGEGQVGGTRIEMPAPQKPPATYLPLELFQTAATGLTYFRILLPVGSYRITCYFMETDRRRSAGQRRMAVNLDGHWVVDKQDFVEAYGYDYLIEAAAQIDVDETTRPIEIYLRQNIGETFIQAIEVEGETAGFNQFKGGFYWRGINCGGLEIQDGARIWEAGKILSGKANERPRNYDATGLYRQWARSEFGERIAGDAAEIFAGIDSNLPSITFMRAGPGNCTPDKSPWAKVAAQYDFVDTFSRLRPLVEGGTHLDQFDYWHHHLAIFKAAARLRCECGREEPSEANLAVAWETLYSHLIGAARSPGDVGTLLSIEQQWRKGNLEEWAAPMEASYRGEPLIYIPVCPTTINESFNLELSLLGFSDSAEVALELCSAGEAHWQMHPMERVCKTRHRIRIPAAELPETFSYRLCLRSGGETHYAALAGETEGISCLRISD